MSLMTAARPDPPGVEPEILFSIFPSRLTAAALGLIIGGALGNAIDRLHWPGVMDFVLFHIETASWRFSWYVFNLADLAIVAGVVALLYDSLWARGAVKAP